ncbi:hypothetical protein LCGC14_0615960 [marine sediment metagenome]|uniref:Uncharacterized protein n=1 Tax=marine sediment metagenome TaxID=412755 RepID=A0A0F9RQJ8_9ZZZZ
MNRPFGNLIRIFGGIDLTGIVGRLAGLDIASHASSRGVMIHTLDMDSFDYAWYVSASPDMDEPDAAITPLVISEPGVALQTIIRPGHLLIINAPTSPKHFFMRANQSRGVATLRGIFVPPGAFFSMWKTTNGADVKVSFGIDELL